MQCLGLTELRLSSLPGHYGVTSTGTELFGVAQALALSKACRNLVTCDLALEGRFEEGEYPMQYLYGGPVLPNPKRLIIRGPISRADFIHLLSVPSLTSLSFSSAASFRSFKDKLFVWVEHVGHQLETLPLHLSSLKEDA